MARMYSSNRGRSGSTRQLSAELPGWSEQDASRVEELVAELAAVGHSTAEIGTLLRDQHAVPDVRRLTGQRIGSIAAAAGHSPRFPEDLMNLMRKAVRLIDHLGQNRKDLHNRRQLQLTESKIRRLARYHQSRGRVPTNWKYDRGSLRLIVE